MIAYIQGTLFEKNLGSCVVQTGGIGYEIFLPQRSIEKFSLQKEVTFFIFHRVKEDQNDLYGFESKEEKLFFEKLISVSGVGPKTALLMLEFSPSQLRKAIEEEDIKFLSQAKGMGKKTVSRLILELKGKLPQVSHLSSNDEKLGKNNIELSPFSQCETALEGLGFEIKTIQKIFKENAEKITDFSDEEVIKWALQELRSF